MNEWIKEEKCKWEKRMLVSVSRQWKFSDTFHFLQFSASLNLLETRQCLGETRPSSAKAEGGKGNMKWECCCRCFWIARRCNWIKVPPNTQTLRKRCWASVLLWTGRRSRRATTSTLSAESGFFPSWAHWLQIQRKRHKSQLFRGKKILWMPSQVFSFLSTLTPKKT